MNQVECRITVSEDDGQIVVSYMDSKYTKVPDFRARKNELSLKTIERINHWVAKYDSNCTEDDLKLLGLHLYHLLFNEEIRSNLDKAIQKSINDESYLKLRLILIFEKSAEAFSQYPWEFLFMPDKSDSFSGKFLARKTELILARYLPQSEVLEKLAPDPMDLPVRILIVSAHPERSDGRNLETIEDDDFISQLLMLKSDSIKIEHLVDPNYETLKEFIKGKNGDPGFVPHILHFIGHGEAGKIALKKTRKDIIEELNRTGKISLVDPDSADDAEWIDKKGISSLFDDVSKPKFVFLNACNAAKSEFRGYNDFSNNLAVELVNSGIPAVLAMQYKITNDDAAEFSQRIYLDIRKGVPIDQAVKNGIRILGDRSPAWNHPRFGIPVFYLGAKDTTFLSVAEPEIEVKQDVDERLIIECLNPRCGKSYNSKFDSCPYCLTGYMLCVHCKKQLPVDANFCPYCKKPQGKGKISASQEKKVSQSGEAKTPLVLEKSSTSVSADSSNANIWPSKN